MQTTPHRKRQPPRPWLIPAIVAAILFIGGVAGNLVANDLQTILEPYRPWVWVSFGIALIVAIAVAIREAHRAPHSPPSSVESQTDGSRVGVGSRIVTASAGRSVAIGRDVKGSAIIPGDENVAVVGGKVAGDVFGGDKITHIYETASPVVSALHQLPPPVGDFTGRADELAELTAKLDQGGISISGLHGLGGIGKTALALKLADQLKPRYPDAQFYLDLKGASREPLAVAEAMAHVIRAYHPTAKLPDTEAELQGLYRSVLQAQRALLLMDNAASAEQVDPLIPPGGCVLLVTSRRHFTLPGLYVKNLEALSPDDARQLLLAIAPRIGGLADEIAGLCGYLPLALRLAGSALVKFVNLTSSDYARRLQDRQRRLQLIEASLNLSYELLSEELQKWWRLLAVFPDTFEETAAAAVWNLEVDKAQDMLGELIAASMVEWNESARRYRLHDLARLFADSCLGTDERGGGKRVHATHYQTVLATANDLYFKGGGTVRGGSALFDLEWRNIEVGQAWAEAEAGGNDQAAELGITYPLGGAYVLNLRQHARERIRWLEVAVGAARRLKQRAREGTALGNLGLAYADLGEISRAVEFYEQYLAIASEIGDRRGEGVALGNLGNAYAGLGETRRAIEFYEQSLLISREIGDRRDESADLGNLGRTYANLGETRRAIEFHERALLIDREIGDRRGEGNALGNLGNAYADLGATRRAIEFLEQALLIFREIGDRRGEGNALGSLGFVYTILGETRRAIELHEQYLAIAREIGDRRGEGDALGNIGWAYANLGEIRRAIEFYEQALVIDREMGNRRAEGIALFNKSRALDVFSERARAIAGAEEALTILEQIEDPNAAKVREKLAQWRSES